MATGESSGTVDIPSKCSLSAAPSWKSPTCSCLANCPPRPNSRSGCMNDVPQSSISRIEQRADMYLSTLRNYVHALGGVLQIQAVFSEGGAVAISRFGEYEDRSYVVRAQAESNGTYRLVAQPLDQGSPLSTKALRV